LKIIRIRDKNKECLYSKNYNWEFDTTSGFFMRYGTRKDDDPDYSPVGPEIADIEVSTICSGPFGTPCSWCYKSNTSNGENMTLETFVKVFNNINPYSNLTQIAFGIGDIDSNPDLIPMFEHCRLNNVVPNLTVNGARLYNRYKDGKTYYEKIVELCGAVAVSHYGDDICFNAVKQFTDLGMTQVNIHKILAEDTLDDCLDLLQKSQVDRRLEKLNAVVFLLLKPKGSRNNLTSLRDVKKYKELIEFAVSNNINIGFDSCGANKFLEAVKGMKNYDTYKMLAEPCESAAFSVYVNVDGRAFPCSFGEGTPGWEEGIDVVNCRDFIRDVWEGEKFRDFRHRAQQNKRSCVFYNI